MKSAVLLLTLSMMLFCSFCPASETSSYSVTGDQIYLENCLSQTDKRYASFLLALGLLKQRNAKILVETGTARGGMSNFVGDGGSTIIFAHWANQNSAFFYSVDINPESVMIAQNAVLPYADSVDVICADSIAFLSNFNQPIDFLYLDSYDFDFADPLPSQQHHLNELKAAYSRLHKNSIVMIDDCDLPYGGKGKLAISFLLEKGWNIIFSGYQVILAH